MPIAYGKCAIRCRERLNRASRLFHSYATMETHVSR